MKPSRLRRPIVMVIVLLLAMLACLPGTTVPTEPPAPTDTVAAPIISSTEAPTMAAGEEYFTEDFETDSGNWSQQIVKNGTDPEADLSSAKIAVDGGRLVFDLGKWLIAYELYDPYDYTDVRIDAHVENRGTNVNDVLLICRASSEGHYLVNIANSGLFAMYAYDAVKDRYTRVADGGSKKIKPGKEFNDYSLICKGRDIVFYVNGSKVRQYTDNQFVYRTGKVGVGIASEDQLPVKVEFDSVKISEP